MSRNFFMFLIGLFLLPIASNAQSTAYGFRVGLNVSTILTSDLEVVNGVDAESYSTNSGFHVGGGIKFKFTDLFGIRAELLFSQKGTKYIFEGEGAQLFIADNGAKISASGNKLYTLSLTNAYLDIPIVAYGKIGKKLEVNGGLYAGFLLSSTAAGQLTFNGNTTQLNNPVDVTLSLDYNFSRDEGIITPDETTAFTFDGDSEVINLPARVGAFFDKDEAASGNPYGVLDAGLTGGIAFFLNEGLYVSANAQYGLIDVTKEEFDFSQTTLASGSDLNLATRNDNDTNLSFQFSVGFSF